ncbi:MAG TPA: hypothetical protein PLI06_02370 [Methanofastidiosum sp.]|nr:hypothetical protein [Methanofastidiosum sp.]HOI76442.1 hypothetical protein [Methanofastidiosum sp.]
MKVTIPTGFILEIEDEVFSHLLAKYQHFGRNQLRQTYNVEIN